MASNWKKLKMVLASKLCLYAPTPDSDVSPPLSGAAPAPSGQSIGGSANRPVSSQKTCTICLASMKGGEGQAIFKAECSHSFHFQCIASNVRHGNQICPVCRAKWKEVPLQAPTNSGPPLPLGRTRINPINYSQDNPVMTLIRPFPPRPNNPRHVTTPPNFPPLEPTVFNDDQPLACRFLNKRLARLKRVLVETYTENRVVPKFVAADDYIVSVSIEATQAPVDLVTVLDISGSMAGTKLALLKRAMGFVISKLGPADRLTVIAFSSSARRLFHLRKMTDFNKYQAFQAMDSLEASGGTNIAQGLRIGAKVMEDRRESNPDASIILFSDGQVTTGNLNSGRRMECIPGIKIPVHAFAFGTDHDASSMRSISEISGGTFSFIETEGVIQDAFAQCFLSVVVKDVQVIYESVNPNVLIGSLIAGTYKNQLMADRKSGCIAMGDLYAGQGRFFGASVNIPTELTSNETCLLKVRCIYTDQLTKELVNSESEIVSIKRPENSDKQDTRV